VHQLAKNCKIGLIYGITASLDLRLPLSSWCWSAEQNTGSFIFLTNEVAINQVLNISVDTWPGNLTANSPVAGDWPSDFNTSLKRFKNGQPAWLVLL